MSPEPLDPAIAQTWADRRSGPPESRVVARSRFLALVLSTAARLPKPASGYLRAAFLHARRADSVTLQTAWGSLVAPVSDHTFMRGVFDEPLETAIIWRLVRPRSTVIDIGANRGWYTVLAASCVGADGRVLAFEPDDRPRRQLEANIALNGFEAWVEVQPIALDATDGNVPFVQSAESALSHLGHGHEGDQPTIAVRSLGSVLDDHALPPISLVKIDVEGAEERVLAGIDGHAMDLLAHAVFMVEVEDEHLRKFGSDLRSVTDRLPRHTWRWICWRHGCLEPLEAACFDSGRNVLAMPASEAQHIEGLVVRVGGAANR